MGWKSSIIKPVALARAKRLSRDHNNAGALQDQVFQALIRKARNTAFGNDHKFALIKTPADFARQVPLRDYEALSPYIDQIRAGASDVLWPGRPRFFAKTSGTTSGVKYIPITTASIPNHIGSAQNALFTYVAHARSAKFFDGKVMFLSGSPELSDVDGIPTGRLSGIVNHLVPSWIRGNQMPSEKTNYIEDWEKKVDAVVKETHDKDMRLIGGIPPWVQMYYERLLDFTGKSTVLEVFPNYSLFVYGGVNYAPYAAKLEALVGGMIDSLETFPASEGFFAYQDLWPHQGLRLNVNSGIFFEFVPISEIHNDAPTRLTLGEVELDKDYALIISNNAGLWAYNIGDTVRFVSLDPPRLIVSGRIKHFISAFGEHVIAKEVEQAMTAASAKLGVQVVEFTVAPQVSPPDGGAPYHEWFIECSQNDADLDQLAIEVDRQMVDQNIYYKDLIAGGVLRPAVLRMIGSGGFRAFMESQGKLGGQNKVPRLMNTRELADQLQQFVLKK